MCVSSHLISEIAATVDHLAVTGRLITDCGTREFIERSSDPVRAYAFS
ncbi:MAG: hypothetical protein ACR2MP_23415 [Streptosporangiaceae bacterium]